MPGPLPTIATRSKGKAARQQRTELMVLITPRLVKPLDPDEVPELPTESTEFLKDSEALGAQLQGGAGTVDAPNAQPAERR